MVDQFWMVSGGELELAGLGHAASDQGAMVIFPSYMLHKVHPVRSGTRLSLVMWFLGSDPGFWHAAERVRSRTGTSSQAPITRDRTQLKLRTSTHTALRLS